MENLPPTSTLQKNKEKRRSPFLWIRTPLTPRCMHPIGRMPTMGVCILHDYIFRERVSWSRVKKRLEKHPEEASQLDGHYERFPLNSVLARSMQDYPSAEIVEAFIQAYPPVLWSGPLEIACWRRAPLDVLQVLVESRPSRPNDARALNVLWNSYQRVFQRQGMNLVHFICQGGREAADIWTKLVSFTNQHSQATTKHVATPDMHTRLLLFLHSTCC